MGGKDRVLSRGGTCRVEDVGIRMSGLCMHFLFVVGALLFIPRLLGLKTRSSTGLAGAGCRKPREVFF